MPSLHIPVLLQKIIEFSHVKDGGIIFDATLGAGGYALSLLEKNEKIVYYGMDKDIEMINIAKKTLHNFNNVKYVNSDYNKIDKIIEENKLYNLIDYFIFDLGISSVHLDTPDRGFSFRFNSKLDMRLDRTQSLSAYEIINNYSETQIADIIYKYGEEKFSRRITKNIVDFRKNKPITTTSELAEIILKSIPKPKKFNSNRVHPATRSFQALRIAVNNELENFDETLRTAAYSLKPGGRLAVVSFHSLEDRIVKNTFKYLVNNEHLAPDNLNYKSEFSILTRKPIDPDDDELNLNIRSRSAKLRVLEKTGNMNSHTIK
ncbi:16S rRNA (cytosine(1402)-N(4))-methyltransferase RsmH [Candidatus Dependentiae bacterium]|nr:16S rRNA (cytosine(1402)-N(4))-methyltransferase RsmH [Candidatus Dependentiae bacterium]